MRRRASRRLVESRVPRRQRVGHPCARLVQSREVFVHFFQQAAMAAGVTDRLFDVADLVALLIDSEKRAA